MHLIQYQLVSVFLFSALKQIFSPTVYMGSWFDHIQDYHKAQDQLNIHFVQYESMLKVGNLLLSILLYFLYGTFDSHEVTPQKVMFQWQI